MDPKPHWDRVYATNSPTDVSWYQREPTLSLQLIEFSGVPHDAGIIDVGGGSSTLVDALLERGFTDLTVLDVAGTALEQKKSKLGSRARQVDWIVSDVRTFEPLRNWLLWHDRAAFHFLVASQDRAAYRSVLDQALAPGGYVMIATFARTGPEHCSGLEVARYSAEELGAELGDGYELVETRDESHETPNQAIQQFQYGLFRRR